MSHKTSWKLRAFLRGNSLYKHASIIATVVPTRASDNPFRCTCGRRSGTVHGLQAFALRTGRFGVWFCSRLVSFSELLTMYEILTAVDRHIYISEKLYFPKTIRLNA